MNQRKVYSDDTETTSKNRRRSFDTSPIQGTSARFARTLDNISNLFDKLSVIDENLMKDRSISSSRSTEADPNSSSVQDRLTRHMHIIAGGSRRGVSSGSLGRLCRSKSDSFVVDAARIDEFRANDANDRCKFLESELSLALDKIRGLNLEKAELRAHERTSRRMNVEVDTANKQTSIAAAELQLAREEVKNLQKLNSVLREKNATLMDANESHQAELDKLKNRMRTLRQEKAKKEAIVEAMSRKRTTEAQSARGSVFEIESAMGKLKERLRSSQCEISSVIKDNRSISEQLEELKLHHSATSTAYDSCVKENEDLRARVKELEDTVNSKDCELKESCDTIRKFESNKSQYISDEVMTNLLSQLADARAEASSARCEAKNALSQMDALRIKCVAALNREKRHRQDLQDMQSTRRENSQDSHEALIHSLKEKLQVSSGIYIKRIQKLHGTVNELKDKIYDLERRELKRAPVVVRSQSSSFTSSLRRKEEEDQEETSREGPVPEKYLTVY